MKCPVCKTNIGDNLTVCPNCKFSDLHRFFINSEDAANWMDEIVIPYRRKVDAASERIEDSYEALFSKQLKSISKHENAPFPFQYEISRKGVVITKYIGNSNNVVIPSHIENQEVYRIGESAFANCKDVQNVIIPNTVQVIDEKAFSVTGLTSLDLPDSVNTIGRKAFHFTQKLTGTIVIPRKVKVIPNEAFSFSHVDTLILKGAITIERDAFSACVRLKRVVFADGLEYVAFSAFKSTAVEKMIFPSSTKKVEGWNLPAGVHVAFLSDNTDVNFDYSVNYKKTPPTIYCNLGSKAHIEARDKGLEYKPLSEFPND